MRVAALYDIHGNLPALEAVLRDVLVAGADEMVIGGDVLPGPMPRECLARLAGAGLACRYLSGNCEREALDLTAGRPSVLPERVQASLRWSVEQLDPEATRSIGGWPATLRVRHPSLGEILFCHATPRNDTELFTRQTAEERLRPIFAAANAPIVVCGHTHMQFDRTVGATRVINAGSVGMPFQAAGAYWLLLGETIELRRTEYDFERAAERIRATSYPDALEFAERYVLHPPTEQEMLDVYARAELKD